MHSNCDIPLRSIGNIFNYVDVMCSGRTLPAFSRCAMRTVGRKMPPPSSRRGRPPTRQSYSTYGRQRGRGLPPLAAPRFQNNDNREEQMYYRKDEQYNYRREPTYYRREEHDNYSREQPDIVVKLEGNDKRQVCINTNLHTL
ncbi:hypothetical protein J6590_066722 [Homalodisca vitripennis]|nr:hypothetical protein J6590_066722 [Homalodisca vitripennis]